MEVKKEAVMCRKVRNLVDILHDNHCKNARSRYSAMDFQLGPRSGIMPLTSFIYEFFLFNSLYQINWEATRNEGNIVSHFDMTEPQKQRDFIAYLRCYTKEHPEYIYRSFEPLLRIETRGMWTMIDPDINISLEDGEDFFKNINNLKLILRNSQTPYDVPVSGKTFETIRKCTYFVNCIRNNIFHGMKNFSAANRGDQKQRIEIYDIFLKGVTSLFFLVSEKKEAACDYVPCPIYDSLSPNREKTVVMSRELIYDTIERRMMKITDARLISQFFDQVSLPQFFNRISLIHKGDDISERASLFYPSAGRDFIAPILLGLPYCTHFYFFEYSHGIHVNRQHQSRSPLSPLQAILRRIGGIQFDEDHRTWFSSNNNEDCLDFEYKGIRRRIHWVHTNNTRIFDMDVELRFYFHRGDSGGEGGSGQEWDSRYLPALRKLIPSGSSAFYITDGEPGGFRSENASEIFNITIPFIERERTYHCGLLPSLKGP